MKTRVLFPPPGNFVKQDVYLRKRWRKVQYLANEFWQRWKRECLQNLQERQKWTSTRRNLRRGDVVLLEEENLVRGQWKLGRVLEIVSGSDDHVRRVKILLADSTLNRKGERVSKQTVLERPIHKLKLILESDDSEVENLHMAHET